MLQRVVMHVERTYWKISFPGMEKVQLLEIYDAFGKRIETITDPAGTEFTIDTIPFARGIYFVMAVLDGLIVKRRFVLIN